MSAIDPLRFLKPRKKQFHLTPTKQNKNIGKQKKNLIPIKCDKDHTPHNKIVSQNSSTNNLNNQSNININNAQSLTNINKSNNINSSKESSYNNTNNTQYNPLRYFSEKVQNYLLQKRNIPLLLTNQYNSNTQLLTNQPKYTNHSNILQQDHNLHNSKQVQPQSVTSILMLQTKHHQQSQLSNLNINNNKYSKIQQTQTKIIQNKKHPIQQSSNISFNHQYPGQYTIYDHKNIKQNHQPISTSPQQQQQQQQHQYQQHQQQHQQQQQLELKPCPICNRKFNPNSYQKHINICQKVFYKKRKQFSSQKQRSLSNKRK